MLRCLENTVSETEEHKKSEGLLEGETAAPVLGHGNGASSRGGKTTVDRGVATEWAALCCAGS